MASVEVSLNYLDDATTSSVRANGLVYTGRNADGTDIGWVGTNIVERRVQMRNGRRYGDAIGLHTHGFELVADPLDQRIDFLDHHDVVERYYDSCASLVQKATGARIVKAFDHNIRSVEALEKKEVPIKIKGGQAVQPPAQIVHGDYTLTGSVKRLRDLGAPPVENSSDTLKKVILSPQEIESVLRPGGRWAIINVWRNIGAEPVSTMPLGLCDARSVNPENLVVFEIKYPHRTGENYFCKFNPAHEWYTFPGLVRDEALLIKQWDSGGGLAESGGRSGDGNEGAPCTMSLHTAFVDPSAEKRTPRWSCEVRCIVLY
jgi:hypothetical protein